MVLLWQTMNLARDVKLGRPELAGLFLIGQPYVFSLASDTMTELPFALGLVIALRLWHWRRFAWSFFVLGLLPMARPEGFLVGPLWGVMLLVQAAREGRVGRLLSASPGMGGLVAWMGACYLLTGNWRYFIDYWSWPAQSYDAYQRGPLLHHVYLWPDYCGPVLLVFFLIGLRGSVGARGWPCRGWRGGWCLWLIRSFSGGTGLHRAGCCGSWRRRPR
ncbi:MAG: hypothetical protein QM813_05795 [Verrucomicrobiota bacterium]